ncbi:unnamed protein product [Vitrella brassicaformis CCMP3155]|uniref:U-box domain-containing protein n=1 Tax=Vitrella brassicaformis (strain CCMP3155) TaxID=1169540 RepID=A0A0G4EGE8_VITBC|nr:unnamed protein product [Vitrella brassicaformis CCMP3155]|eukprot:CEL94474.1 unnamed protein product [Vitrella brassicaformis CCMP3155]
MVKTLRWLSVLRVPLMPQELLSIFGSTSLRPWALRQLTALKPDVPQRPAVPNHEFPASVERCPISLAVPRTPVITPSGHCYELSAILRQISDRGVDPLTLEPLGEGDLAPNRYAVHHIECCARQIVSARRAAAAGAALAADHATNTHRMSLLKMSFADYKDSITVTYDSLTPPSTLVEKFLTNTDTDAMGLIQWHKTHSQGNTHFVEVDDVVWGEFETEMIKWLNDYNRDNQEVPRQAFPRRSITGFAPVLIRDAVTAIIAEALK